MSSRDDAAALYAMARARLAEIVSELVDLRLDADSEARAVALAEFMASSGWPEHNAQLALEASLRALALSPAELEEETAKLLRRLRECPT
ncbi:MAG: hypothetical protein IPN34_01730 [Planctomycetes bacterium]|nr:hypothetical protein [Planctomycetota bacterium]